MTEPMSNEEFRTQLKSDLLELRALIAKLNGEELDVERANDFTRPYTDPKDAA
jgi:hypothetical protein